MPMTHFHEDDSIFNLLADDSSDPQQPMIVESSDSCPDTLVDSSDDFPDTVVQSSEHGSDEDKDSLAIGRLNGHFWFPHAEPQLPPITAHSLCELWKDQPTMCEEEVFPEEESYFDSQCTANDNPGLPDSRALPTLHFTDTRDMTFWKSVWSVVEQYTEWCEISACLLDLGPHWEQNCDVVTSAIQSIVSTRNEFKIGITADPYHRFWKCAGGEYSRRFRTMTIVYVAPFSNKYKLHSTGMMEIDQIAKFKHYSGCLNVGPGGEGASLGSPHFLYVVTN